VEIRKELRCGDWDVAHDDVRTCGVNMSAFLVPFGLLSRNMNSDRTHWALAFLLGFSFISFYCRLRLLD